MSLIPSTHPPHQAENVIRVRTVDNIIHAAPHSLLVKYCTFIADLPPFLYPTENNGDTIISLPSATSEGLRFVVDLLRYSEAQPLPRQSPLPWRKRDLADLQPVVDALVIAEAYDIPLFTQLLLDAADKRLPGRALYAWALCALAGDEERLDHFEQKTLGIAPPILPPSASALLEEYVPYYISRLHRRQAAWLGRTKQLLLEMSTLAPPYNGFDDYSKKCSTGYKCGACERIPAWTEMRGRAAESVLQAIAANRGGVDRYRVSSAIDRVAPCSSCSHRLYETFLPPVLDFCRWARDSGICAGRQWQGRLRIAPTRW